MTSNSEQTANSKESENTKNASDNSKPVAKAAATSNRKQEPEFGFVEVFFLLFFVIAIVGSIFFLVRQLLQPTPINPFMQYDNNYQGFRGKTRDSMIKLKVDLKDMYVGSNVEFEIMKNAICKQCGGSGAAHGEKPKQCQRCHGRGVIETRRQFGGMILQSEDTCNVCHGRGEIIASKCPVCHGNKIVREKRKISITIPKGAREGIEIRVPEESDEMPMYKTGDLIVSVVSDDHPSFTRKGVDLHTTITISLVQALTGFSVEFEHLDGHLVKIQRDSISYPGEIVKIVGEGMPANKAINAKAGNLYVTIMVEFPESIDYAALDVLQTILPHELRDEQ